MPHAWTDASALGVALAQLEAERQICRDLAPKLDDLVERTSRLFPTMNLVAHKLTELGIEVPGGVDAMFELSDDASAYVSAWADACKARPFANVPAGNDRYSSRGTPIPDVVGPLVDNIERIHDWVRALIDDAGTYSAVWLRSAGSDGDVYPARVLDTLDKLSDLLRVILRGAPSPQGAR